MIRSLLLLLRNNGKQALPAKEVITVSDGAHQNAQEQGTIKKTLYIILFIVLFLAAGGMMFYGMVTLAAALIHW